MLYYWLVSTMYVHTTGLNWWNIQDSWILQAGHSRGIPCYPHPPIRLTHTIQDLYQLFPQWWTGQKLHFWRLETSGILPRSCSTPRRNHGLVGKLHHLLRPSKGCLNIRGMGLFGWVSPSVSHSVPWKITIAPPFLSAPSYPPVSNMAKHALTSMKCSHDANFSRGVPSQPCLMESLELDQSPFCHSAGIIIPSTAEKKRPDLSYVGGRMKHVHCRFPVDSPNIPNKLWIDYRFLDAKSNKY